MVVTKVPKRPLYNHIGVIFGIHFDLLVSFAVISIPITSTSVEKKRRTRRNPIVVIISEYCFLNGSHKSAKTSPCNHIGVIFGIRFDILISFAVISIPNVSKLVEKKRRTRRNPTVTIISE